MSGRGQRTLIQVISNISFQLSKSFMNLFCKSEYFGSHQAGCRKNSEISATGLRYSLMTLLAFTWGKPVVC